MASNSSLNEIQFLLKSAYIFKKNDQDKDLVEVVFLDEELVKKFQGLFLEAGIEGINEKNSPRKIEMFIEEGKVEFKFILSAYEFNTIMQDDDEFSKSVCNIKSKDIIFL